jgi:hypothetical protein
VDCRADTRLPLVADYAGAQVNTSFQSVDIEKGPDGPSISVEGTFG